jgi:hypothetical protein
MMESIKSFKLGKVWLKWYAVMYLYLYILCGLTPSLTCTKNPKLFSFLQRKYTILSSSSQYCITVKVTLLSSAAIHMNKSNGSLNDWHTVEYIVYSVEREVVADGTCWKKHGGEKRTVCYT